MKEPICVLSQSLLLLPVKVLFVSAFGISRAEERFAEQLFLEFAAFGPDERLGTRPAVRKKRRAALHMLRGPLLLDPEILETFDIDCCKGFYAVIIWPSFLPSPFSLLPPPRSFPRS